MKTTKLIFGLAFSVLASSAFALPAINANDSLNAPVIAEGGSNNTNIGPNRQTSDGADRVGANRLAADGADRVGANRLTSDGADRVGANRLAADGADRVGANRRV
ncbi:hypothetical protein Q1J52_07225 [Pseudomonas lijiangensis]|uniref:hypothetical protein n=1 Tax=Pseudomonas lijiangensis TaxID=2995658 RepID=UPI0034D753EA